jgi:glutamyl-tRNA synthetase
VAEPPPCEIGPKLAQIVAAAGDRLKVLGDIVLYEELFVADAALVYDEAAFDQRLRKDTAAPERLRRCRAALAAVEPFTAAAIEGAVQQWLASEGLQMGQIVHALRVAVTGKAVGLGLFDTLAILGRASSLARVERALARL